MPEPDLVSRFIAKHPNTLHGLLASPDPLAEWVLLSLEGRLLVSFRTAEVDAADPDFPPRHRRVVAAELAKPRQGDELLLFVVEGAHLAVARIDRARIAREVGPPFVIDVRNHFPMPWPTDWHGPYELHIPKVYGIETPDCQIMARIEDEAWDYEHRDDDGSPRHIWRLELGVTRAMDPALPDDEQIAAITARFRHCGAWVERTHLHQRRHPSRRIFGAEVKWHREGTTPWPEIQPPEVMLGPPPGWEPVGRFQDRPLVFRIEGTKLRVEWSAPEGANWFEAATGRVREPSRFTISTPRRKPTDEEAGIVFAMLGGAAFTEEMRPRSAAERRGRARVFLATAAWLREPAGRA